VTVIDQLIDLQEVCVIAVQEAVPAATAASRSDSISGKVAIWFPVHKSQVTEEGKSTTAVAAAADFKSCGAVG